MEMIIHLGSYARICVPDTVRNYLAALYRLAVFVSRCARWERIEYIMGVKMFLCMKILISIRNIIMHGSMCDGTGEKILSSNRYFSITNPVFHKSGCTGTCICRCGYCNRKQHGCSDRKWWDRTHEGLSSGLSFSGAIEQKGVVEDQAEYIPGFSCVRFSYRNLSGFQTLSYLST